MANNIINYVLDLVDTTNNEVNTYEEKIPTGDQVVDDFEYARENMYDLLDKSKDALTDLLDLARASQAPRTYEVLNQMFKTMSEINKDLIELQKTKKEITVTDPAAVPTNVTNNLFVGSTAALTKLMDERLKNR